MSGRKSKAKGGRGEREAASILNKLLNLKEKFYRGRQYSGGPDTPDLKCHIPTSLHAEVKRDESTMGIKLYNALHQAKEDCKEEQVPFVMSRRNNKKWAFVIEEDNLVDFCKEIVRLYERTETE